LNGSKGYIVPVDAPNPNLDDKGFVRKAIAMNQVVTWNDAVAYAKWLSNQTGKNYRLPTEAEWEYAARAGTETKYWWGNKIDKSKANYGSNLGKTSLVGNYAANNFGLYDTSGNVWEWTCSEYEDKYNGKEKNCINKNSNKSRVLRGGSWYFIPWFVRAALRYWNTPDDRVVNGGFRVVLAAAWTN
jgi:formylglycine-generating enzyme required for sulfatase activity